MGMEAAFLGAPGPQSLIALARGPEGLQNPSAPCVAGCCVVILGDQKCPWLTGFSSDCRPHGIMKFYSKIASKDLIELLSTSATPCQRWEQSVCFVCAGTRRALGLLISGSSAMPVCGMEVWQGDFFHLLFIDGVLEEFDEIYLELASEHLYRVATSTE